MTKKPDTYERMWPTVILTPIQVANHIITVLSTKGLHTKQVVALSKPGQQTEEFVIKRVLSDTQIQVGTSSTSMVAFSNPTQFDGGTLTMSEQNRNAMGSEITMRAVYMEEPAVALRTISVDRFGQALDSVNYGTGSSEQPLDPNRVDPLGLNRIAVDAYISNMPAGIRPQEFDDIIIERNPITKDTGRVKYFLNSNLIKELELEYDIDDDLVRVRKV